MSTKLKYDLVVTDKDYTCQILSFQAKDVFAAKTIMLAYKAVYPDCRIALYRKFELLQVIDY